MLLLPGVLAQISPPGGGGGTPTTPTPTQGYYKVSYESEGEVVEVGPLGTTHYSDYSLTSDGGIAGSGISADYFGPGLAGAAGRPGSASCSGKITAKFQWVPVNGEDPPASVIVVQTASANWSGDNGGCANGLSSPVVPFLGGESCSGSKYEIISRPGPQFTRDCSPEANASVSINGTAPVLAAGANVYYRAEAFSPYLHFSGVIPDTTESIIGRSIFAVVEVSPSHYEYQSNLYPNAVPAFDFTDFVWVIPGTKFESFYVSEDLEEGHKVDVDAGLVNEEWPHWNYSQEGDYLVTANLSVSIGGTPIAGRAKAELELFVAAPTYDMTATVGEMRYLTNPTTGLISGVIAGYPHPGPYGIMVEVEAIAPMEHDGVICTVQLVNGEMTALIGPPFQVWNALDTDGEFALDSRFPQYPAEGTTWFANGTTYQAPDSPSLWCNEPLVGVASMTIDLEFNNFLMFKSNRRGDWTPLAYISWIMIATFVAPDYPDADEFFLDASSMVETREHPNWESAAFSTANNGTPPGGGGVGGGVGGGGNPPPQPNRPILDSLLERDALTIGGIGSR